MKMPVLAVLALLTIHAGQALAADKTAIVAKTGGDYPDPVTAMNDIGTWCGTPSASNPCLLKLQPGVFDIGEGILWLQPFVDVEGSGENVTTIRGSNSGAVLAGTFLENAELRLLTIESYGTGPVMSVLVNSPAGPTLTHVSLASSGGGIFLSFGSWSNATMTLRDTKIETTEGNAVYCQGRGTLVARNADLVSRSSSAQALVMGMGDSNLNCEATLTDVHVGGGAAGAVVAGGSLAVRDSRIDGAVLIGAPATIVNSKVSGAVSAGSLVRLQNTELSVPPVRTGSGQLQCLGNFDANLAPVSCRR